MKTIKTSLGGCTSDYSMYSIPDLDDIPVKNIEMSDEPTGMIMAEFKR